MSKSSNNSEKKSKSNLLMIIICIIITIVMFFVGVFVGKIHYEPEVRIVDEVITEEDVTLEALRNDLVNKVNILERISQRTGFELWPEEKNRYYSSGDIYIKDTDITQIPNELKLYTVLENLYYYDLGKSYVTTNYDFGSMSMYKNIFTQLDVEKVEKEYKYLFGNTTISHKKFDGCPSFIYDSVNNKYYGSSECGGTSAGGIVTYVNKVTSTDDEAYVYVSLGSAVDGKFYTDFEMTKEYTANVENGLVINENNYKEFSEYKYTFVKEKGNYIFNNIKKIK